MFHGYAELEAQRLQHLQVRTTRLECAAMPAGQVHEAENAALGLERNADTRHEPVARAEGRVEPVTLMARCGRAPGLVESIRGVERGGGGALRVDPQVDGEA